MKQEENQKAWTGHPRPQMRRKEYKILQDGWELNSRPIRMPYPPQSRLSGYDGPVGDELCYTCKFSVPDEWKEGRVILHFGAVDQIAQVRVNGADLGTHEGGYLPFSFDITEMLLQESYLELTAIDELSKDYPYGKQCKKPHGMWYTPVSGIWQQVWLEHVPDLYIEKLEITPSLDSVKISVSCNKIPEHIRVVITLADGKTLEAESADGNFEIEIPNPRLWTPEDPYLYDLMVFAGADCVQSYFALRTIEICRMDGVHRVCLNQKPIFLHGVLDQGYFEDGLFLPESEAGYEQDILNMKRLGFNLLRKHIKVEPECFYYACDRLGMLVMQDMVNNGSYHFLRDTALPTVGLKHLKDTHRNRSPKVREVFRKHTRDTIAHLYNHPCIVAYTIFNEGWGQFLADEMYDMVKKLDSTRLVDATSGWFVQKKNDFDSEHIYFRLKKLRPKERPLFVTECGGYQYLLADHFYGKKEYGYGACKSSGELTSRIEEMYEKMILPYIRGGVCGCIYTQLSDVEGEINGLYTYDRKVCKVDAQRLRKMADRLKDKKNFDK
ncbi:MAG: glycoside hydrolase family 2 [Lachnospiraceae bacterium]|nr:glycoside hydrolase family 2 [Lachnospiraceae bacterium]